MKRTIAALILAAAAATPAMAQTYVYSNGMAPGYAVQAQPDMSYGYGAYAYAQQYDSRIINPTFAQDPDPNVRLQLQNQSDLTDR